MSRPPTRGYLLVFVASLAFATSAPLSRLARPAHPLVIACFRVALAALLLALLDVRGLVRAARALTPAQRARIALAGALLGGHFGLFQWGLDETSLAAAVSLVSLEPLSVVLAAWAFFAIVPRRLEQIGVLVATAGALLVAQAAGEGEHRLKGDLLVLGAVLLFGLYVASARALRDAIAVRHYAVLVYAAAALTIGLCLPFVQASPNGELFALSGRSAAAIGALALVPTTLGHTLVQSGARTLSPSLLALVCPGETLGSIVIAIVLFGKSPSALEAAGGLVILAGALLAVRAQAQAGAVGEP